MLYSVWQNHGKEEQGGCAAYRNQWRPEVTIHPGTSLIISRRAPEVEGSGALFEGGSFLMIATGPVAVDGRSPGNGARRPTIRKDAVIRTKLLISDGG